MMGDDGAGPLLAEMCAANPQGSWVVIDGGSARKMTWWRSVNCIRTGC
jgi:Ni,Fe-hydrogenase maturation factor